MKTHFGEITWSGWRRTLCNSPSVSRSIVVTREPYDVTCVSCRKAIRVRLNGRIT